MGALGVVALIVLVTVVASIVAAWMALAIYPGRIAKQRGHPQADAINVCGWIGALTMGLLAPIAFIWAYSSPSHPILGGSPATPEESDSDSEEEDDS